MELKHDWRIIIESQEKVDAYSARLYKQGRHLFIKKYLLNTYYVPGRHSFIQKIFI